VLIIYTGGTMGMTKQNGSLAPTRGYLPRRISEMEEMADPEMPRLDLIE
jgi:L-asparaginase/Glu-tRNA(Gln) amidotransferase subunit D